jgi:hypothetical protein
VRYEDGQAEGEGCSYAIAPAGEMQCVAETVEPHFAGLKDEVIDQFMVVFDAVCYDLQLEVVCWYVF